jgi:hypothetical protein
LCLVFFFPFGRSFVVIVDVFSTKADIVYVHRPYFIVRTEFDYNGPTPWSLVIIAPSSINSSDDIDSGSISFAILCLLGGLESLFTIALMVWVAMYRNLHLWKIAQPEILLLILAAQLSCSLTPFAVLGQ